jgi:hypothetical protein
MAEIPSMLSPLAQSSSRGLKRARSGSQLGSSPATRPRQDVPEPERVAGSAEPASPENEHLAIQTSETDDSHFDNEVLEKMAIFGWKPENSFVLALAKDLLVCIVNLSDDQLDPTLKNHEAAAVFLGGHEVVMEQLKAAWEKRTFVEIRQHGKRPTFRFRSTFQLHLVSSQTFFAPEGPFPSQNQALINLYMTIFKVSHPCHPTFALY